MTTIVNKHKTDYEKFDLREIFFFFFYSGNKFDSKSQGEKRENVWNVENQSFPHVPIFSAQFESGIYISPEFSTKRSILKFMIFVFVLVLIS